MPLVRALPERPTAAEMFLAGVAADTLPLRSHTSLSTCRRRSAGYVLSMSAEELVARMEGLANRLTPGDLEHTLEQVTAAAVQLLPGVHYANITVRHQDGRLETVAPTDELLREVDAAQFELQEGPCYDAATDVPHVASPHLAADERFPRYGRIAVNAGIRAQAGIRLFDTPKPSARGALNLYSRDVGTFSDMDMIALLFSHQAAVALDYAYHVQNLQEALQSRQQIGMAVGIVMQRFDLNEQRAFGFLTRMSQNTNVKLREIAAQVIADRAPSE